MDAYLILNRTPPVVSNWPGISRTFVQARMTSNKLMVEPTMDHLHAKMEFDQTESLRAYLPK